MIKKEMSKGFASKRLLNYVKAGDVYKAAKRINDGGRHLELWSFMKHRDLLYDFPIWKYDLECSHLEKGYVTGRTILQLAPVVGYRAEKARQAAIAFLSLKRRGLLSKDMSTLIAKMVYQPYENRYSEKWGLPIDWTELVIKTPEFLLVNQLKLVAFVMVFAVLSHLVRKFLILIA